MATNKIKFRMSVEKIEFEFEGDYEQGKAIQQGISQTLTGLSSLQNRAMGVEESNPRKLIESKAVDPAPPKRRRRRRASVGDSDGEAMVSEGGEVSDGNEASRQLRSSVGPSPTGLLIELRKAGFFAEGKTSGDVLGELHRKAYSTLRSSSLTSPLQRLVQKDVLRRDHDGQKNQWVYTNGTNDDVK